MKTKTKRHETQEVPRCREVGDFGHTNLWGTPRLMFDVVCALPVGHEGPHRAKMSIHVVPSYEPNGMKIDTKSVKVSGETFVEWTDKPKKED